MAARFSPLDQSDPVEIAGYALRARLGSGGMGNVYLSFTRGGRPVALKVVRKEFADDPEFRRRFRQEVAAAQRVQGLYTAPVVDADPDVHVAEMRAARPDIATLFIDRRHRHYEILARLHLQLGAIMRPDHPLAGSSSLTLTQCAAHPVVMLNDPWLLDAASETEFIRSGAQFNARVKSNSLVLMKQAIRDGLGIGFFTPTGFVDELARGELIHVPLAEPGLANSEIGLLVHRERLSTAPISLAASALAEAFEDFGARLAESAPFRTRTIESRAVNA